MDYTPGTTQTWIPSVLLQRDNSELHARELRTEFGSTAVPSGNATVDSVRLCFICTEYPPGLHGGIGSSYQTLARALVERGHKVFVVGIYPPAYQGPRHFEDRGVQVWRFPECRIRFFGWALSRLYLYARVRALIMRAGVE